MSGTADQLEIILFLIGLVSLAMEIFVFPGFGIFGISGILLMLCSIVLASHTFIWPTQDYEYQELGHTLLQVMGMLWPSADVPSSSPGISPRCRSSTAWC